MTEKKRTAVKKKRKGILRSWIKGEDYYDYNLLAAVILLICFGLILLCSASYYEGFVKADGDYMFYFRRQARISLGAVIGAVLISMFNYHVFSKVAGFTYILAFILMLLVRISPLGVEHNGSRRWLKIGIEFQPSEVAKIAIILFLPIVIIKMGKRVKSFKAIFILLVIGGIQALGAKVLTDNLSTALIILGIACALIYISHPKTAPFAVGLVAAVVIVTIVVNIIGVTADPKTADFRTLRVLTWLNPEENLEDGGYQVIQGLYAIGSGGFFGKGLGNSEQKLSTIPEAQNDMIFSIICEELGVFGAILVLLMFGYLLYRLFFIAQNAPDLYGSLIVSGIFAHISLQVILNVCVVLNLIPTTGITLPFISYGGTSVLFLMCEVGIALSVSRQIKFAQE